MGLGGAAPKDFLAGTDFGGGGGQSTRVTLHQMGLAMNQAARRSLNMSVRFGEESNTEERRAAIGAATRGDPLRPSRLTVQPA